MTPPADLVHLTYTVIFAVNIFQVVTLLTLAEVAAKGVHTLSVVWTEVLSSYTFINIWGQTTLKDILLHLNSKDDVQSLCNGRQQVNINKIQLFSLISHAPSTQWGSLPRAVPHISALTLTVTASADWKIVLPPERSQSEPMLPKQVQTVVWATTNPS